MNQLEIKKWTLKLLPFGIAILMFFYGSYIYALPYLNEVAAFVIPLIGYRFINKINDQKEQIRSGEILPLRDQNDDFSKFMRFVVAVLFIGFSLYLTSKDGFTLSMFNTFMFGLILLIAAFNQSHFLFFECHQNTEVFVSDKDFKIRANDRSIEFSGFQISATQADEGVNHLNGLLINPDEAKKIKNWIESKLRGTNIDWTWKSNNNVVKM